MCLLLAKFLNWLSNGEIEAHYQQKVGMMIMTDIQEEYAAAIDHKTTREADAMLRAHTIVTDHCWPEHRNQ